MSRTSIVGRLVLGLLATASATAGCGPPPIAPPPGTPPPMGVLVQGLEVRRAAMPLHRPAQADRAALPEVVKANNAFAVDLYHAMRSHPGNILFSPASLTAGLAMLRAGARGETAAEIDRALHRTATVADGALSALIQDLNADGQKNVFQVRLADAVWIQDGYPIVDAYRATLRDVFAIDDQRRVDFNGHPGEAAAAINAWVAGRTGGKIAGAISPEAVKVPTRMVLTSALYFRGVWADGFFREKTQDAPFHLSQSRTVTVPMMHKDSWLKVHGYVDLGSYRVLSMSCGEGAFAMVIFLPKEIEGLGALEAALTPEALDAVWPKLTYPTPIEVSLPRFRLATSRILNEEFKLLRISRAFDRSLADFSGINGKTNDLFVRAASHDTYIDVNEEGIEAAAFAGVISADGDDDKAPVVVVDRPFFYLIRDNRSGCIVFIGRVVNPVESTRS